MIRRAAANIDSSIGVIEMMNAGCGWSRQTPFRIKVRLKSRRIAIVILSVIRFNAYGFSLSPIGCRAYQVTRYRLSTTKKIRCHSIGNIVDSNQTAIVEKDKPIVQMGAIDCSSPAGFYRSLITLFSEFM